MAAAFLERVGSWFRGLWEFVAGLSASEVGYYLFLTLLVIVLYEILRFVVVGRLKRRFERSIRKMLKGSNLSTETYKFTHRLVIKEELLADPWLIGHMADYAQSEAKGLDDVRAEAEGYIDEIVPNFSLLSYYKVGYTLAKTLVNFVYRVVVDEENRHRLDAVPPDAARVYVVNHRSNADYVVVAYVLAGQVSLSYAVGEWARVWPLERLFRSFGAYFVRRGYKNELYHRVLERYVQLLARRGVTQGVFPEGKLSRDGSLNPPKLGLLSWIAGAAADPQFRGRLTFIPVAINYDWVLEDENLVSEALHQGRARPTGFLGKVGRLLAAPFVLLALGIANLARHAARRPKHHGTATVSFGDPVVLDEFLAGRGVTFRDLDAEARKPHVAALGERLMEEIGRAVPATPVVLVAEALLRLGRERVGREELVAAVTEVRRECDRAGVRVVLGREFARVAGARAEGEADAEVRPADILGVERALTGQEEAELVVRHGTKILRRRRLVKRLPDRSFQVAPHAIPLLAYYANSVAHLTGNRRRIGAGDASALGEKSADLYASRRGAPRPASLEERTSG